MHYLAVALFTGCLGILLGLAPVGDLIEHFREDLDRFRDSLFGFQSRPARPLVHVNRRARLDGQIWFAVGGAIVILLALVAYLTS